MALIDKINQTKYGVKLGTRTQATYPNHVFDPSNDPNRLALSDDITILHNSTLDLDGKKPDTLPSAFRSSATHVYDPDFSTGQATDPLLNLTGTALKLAQTNRRGNNTVTFQSVYAAPVDQTTRKYQDQVTGGGGASGFETGNVGDRV